MENKTPKMISLNILMTEQEAKVLSKFLKKGVKAAESVIRDHQESKIKAESILAIHKLRKENGEHDEDEDHDPLRTLIEHVTGHDPVEDAQEFLDHYDRCVQEKQDVIRMMSIVVETIKSQIIK